MLLILGIQLSNVDGNSDFQSVGIASALKLLLAPVFAFAAVLAAGSRTRLSPGRRATAGDADRRDDHHPRWRVAMLGPAPRTRQ